MISGPRRAFGQDVTKLITVYLQQVLYTASSESTDTFSMLMTPVHQKMIAVIISSALFTNR